MTLDERDEFVSRARKLCDRNSGNEIEADVSAGEREFIDAEDEGCVWVRAWVRVPKEENLV